MERYFLGNNTHAGFRGYYESELSNKRLVVLLKGGPGTGKSTLLKNLASDAKSRGYETELWYCSGDPKSLDGVYIKNIDTVIVDATAPHASGADLPKIKDFIFDLAGSLDSSRLMRNKSEIDALLKCKKRHFIRAYEHLKSAYCHYLNQLELESEGLRESEIRSLASSYAYQLKQTSSYQKYVLRKLFNEAITADGEDKYFDHLRGKRIIKIMGNELSLRVFFGELAGLVDRGTLLLDPLDGESAIGVVLSDIAIVKNVGHFDGQISESVNLALFEGESGDEERLERERSIMLAKEELNKAREMHLAAENYFVDAMDFSNNEKIYGNIKSLLGL